MVARLAQLEPHPAETGSPGVIGDGLPRAEAARVRRRRTALRVPSWVAHAVAGRSGGSLANTVNLPSLKEGASEVKPLVEGGLAF
jgi:hypothetical protein